MPEADTLPVEIETGPNPAACIIWLHGLGADGHDFEPIVPDLGLPGVRFVFPHAPYRSVSINNGYVMRAWYDLGWGANGMFVQNPDHLQEACDSVTDLIGREAERGLPSQRVLLAGFSQGGVVALHAGLRSEKPLAGVLALSAPVVDPQRLLARVSPAGRGMPVFLGYGTEDTMVPLAIGQGLREGLRGAGIEPEWHEYAIGHGVSSPEIQDISLWIGRVLAK